jgi:nucleoside-diphosphate-sugar epimerase
MGRYVLVTGSAGHVGEALMRRFRLESEPALGLDIKPSPFTECVGSICDRGAGRRRGVARQELGWRPKYDFRHVLDCLRAGVDFRSPLAREVGSKRLSLDHLH